MRRFLCLLLGTSLALFFSAAASAQVGLEVHGLYGFNFSDDDVDLDNTFGGGGSLVICLGPNVKLDLGGDYLRPEGDKGGEGNYLQLIPVAATLRIGGNAGPVFIYVGGGAGYSFNDTDFKDNAFVPGTLGKDWELEDSMTYHACGGAEFGLSPNIALRGEFRYVWLKPELKYKPTNTKSDLELNHMQARAGLAFYF